MPQLVTDSRSSITTDPLRNFRFHVDIVHDVPASSGRRVATTGGAVGFMGLTGLNVTTEVIPYRQGGFNTTPQKMPGQSDFTPITLTRGVVKNTPQVWFWMKQLFFAVQGAGYWYAHSGNKDFRANLNILVLDHPWPHSTAVPIKMWIRVFRAWPMSLAYSDLNAGDNAVLVEQVTLAHEGWDITWGDRAHGDAPQPKYH